MCRKSVFAAILVAVLMTTAVGCEPAIMPSKVQQPGAVTADAPVAPSQPATIPAEGPRGTIVFDAAHGEIFQPQDTSELGQSGVVGKMQQAGYGVMINSEPITDKTLDGVAALYVAGPMRAFTKDEEKVLDDYLERGGTVILTIHVPFPVLAIPARWGLPVGTAVVMSPTGDPNNPGIFATTHVKSDQLTKGVKTVAVYSGWSVTADKNRLETAKIVVETGPEAVEDSNGDQKLDGADKQAPFGIVGVTRVGSGRVIVLGDDAIFANLGINSADNGKLFDNILELINAPKGA